MSNLNPVPNLGRLKQMDIREVWQNEPRHFTPWLAQSDNLALLGEAIGMDLELDSVEKSVGPFSADILCKNPLTDEWVLIENQLEYTDHRHLGQIITYAAGLQATTIIWIARSFTEEHRAALDWLNTHTHERIRFFGVTIECWRIGNSDPAPQFHIIARPNDWVKGITDTHQRATGRGAVTPYWTAFREVLEANPGELPFSKAYSSNSCYFSLGKPNVGIYTVVSVPRKSVQVQVYLAGTQAQMYYDRLVAEKEHIEAQTGSIIWQGVIGRQDCRVYISLENTDPADTSDWERQHEWMRERAKIFYAVFAPIVQSWNDALPLLPEQEIAME